MSELNEKTPLAQQEDNSLNLSDIWNMIWDYKWWYLICTAVCLFAAVLYIYVTPKSYVRTAKVIINEDAQANVMSDLLSMTGGGGAGSYSSNANNEAEAFASPDLMTKVVERLALETSYTEDQGIRKVAMYKTSPVEMTIVDTLVSTSFSFRLTKSSDSTFFLKDFTIGNDRIRNTEAGVLSHDMETPVGTLRFDSTLNIDEWDKDIYISWVNPRAKAKYFSTNLTVTVTGKNSTVLAISLTDGFPQRAERILNTLVDIYNEEWVMDKNKAARNTAQFITERIAVIEKELSGIETDLRNYKEQNKLTDIKAMGQSYLEELNEYSSKNFEVRNQLSIAGYIRDYLNDPKNSRSLLPSNSGLSSTSVETQISEYNNLFLEREKLISNSSENNPLIQDMTYALDAIKSAILRSIDNLIGTLQLQVAQLDSEEQKLLSGMASSSGQEMDLLSIERQQQVKQSLYLYLLQKREENDIASLMTVSNTRLIVTPTGSSNPSSPNTMLILMAAIILGLGIPFAVIFLIHAVDNTVRAKSDISSLSASFLAEIPLMHQGGKWSSIIPMSIMKRIYGGRNLGIVVKHGSRDAVNEAFRVMRTNLGFMAGKDGATKVILVSSFNPGSGKTFISANLAATVAIRGAKVVVLDLDLRKGSLSRSLHLHNEGLSMYLSGNVKDIDSITVQVSENLNVLPSGILPPNPSELLSTDRFRSLIAELRTKYDCILLDCPPINMVADTAIIAGSADMTIFVMRAGLMDKRALPAVEDIIRSGVYPRMTIALNGVESASRRYGYGRYGYGYGYGEV